MRKLGILLSGIIASSLVGCASPSIKSYPPPPKPVAPPLAKAKPMAMPMLKLEEKPDAKAKLSKNIKRVVMPDYCSPRGFKVIGEDFLLNPGKNNLRQRLYLLHNSTKRPIYVVHNGAHPASRMGWMTRIYPQRFTALALDKDNFELTCEQRDGEKLRQINCSRVIQICRANRPKFIVGTEGSYWLVENQPSARRLAIAAGVRGVRL